MERKAVRFDSEAKAENTGQANSLSSNEKAKLVVKSLIKYLSGKKLYAPNNPILEQFAEELKGAFASFFEDEESLVLSINQFCIHCENQKVYENEKREESLAFLLYKDGIGELTFRSPLPFDELDRFVDIIKDDMHRTSPEDDIVTRLWKADLSFITYRVLDEYLSGEFGDGNKSAASSGPSLLEATDHAELLHILEDRGRVVVKPGDPMGSLAVYFNRLVEGTAGKGSSESNEEHLEELLESTFKVGAEEFKLSNEELLREKREDGLFVLMKTMFEFTFQSDNPSVLRDIFTITDRLVNYYINLRKPERLQEVLKFINRLDRADCSSKVAEYCEAKKKELTDCEVLRSFAGDLDQWSNWAEKALSYFCEAGEAAVPILRELLERLPLGRLQEETCNCMIKVAGKAIMDVIENMKKEKSESAIAAIQLAEKASLEAVPQSLRELIYYPDRRVRDKLLKYLAHSQDNRTASLLVRACKDEDKRIRLKALSALEGRGEPIVKKLLHNLAFGKDLAKKDQDEKEIIFRILGSVGDSETVENLREFMGKKSFMQITRSRENKLLAIRALEHFADGSAIDLLRSLSEDGNSLVKARAKRALARCERGVHTDTKEHCDS